jgi:hypothetical protein
VDGRTWTRSRPVDDPTAAIAKSITENEQIKMTVIIDKD